MGRFSAASALIVAAIVLLTGCSEDEPAPPPSTTASSSSSSAPPPSSSSSSTTAAPAPPALSPEATTMDAAGAAAFVRHWFDLVNYAYATGDTAPLREVANPQCGNCNEVMDAIDEHLRSGGTYQGGNVTVQSAEATTPDSAGRVFVTVLIAEAELTELGPGGQIENGLPATSSVLLDFLADFTDGEWSTFGIAVNEAQT